MIQAITNQQVGLNVITELIIGYALPGRPVAMMMFKTWSVRFIGGSAIFNAYSIIRRGYITMAQGNISPFQLYSILIHTWCL
jgi:hypothetical protein